MSLRRPRHSVGRAICEYVGPRRLTVLGSYVRLCVRPVCFCVRPVCFCVRTLQLAQNYYFLRVLHICRVQSIDLFRFLDTYLSSPFLVSNANERCFTYNRVGKLRITRT